MKSFKLLIILFLFLYFQSYSQSNNDFKFSSKLKLIQDVKEHCQLELEMSIPDYFFTRWSQNESPSYYLYVSKKDTLGGVFDSRDYKFFGINLKKAQDEKVNYDSLGFPTLLYRTYGNTTTMLSNHLLSYSTESISFIAFHEATHLHIRANGKIPYIIEEAVCELVANYGTFDFFRKNKELRKRKAIKQIKQLESVALEINKLITYLELNNTNYLEMDYSMLIKKINKFKKRKNKFKTERYDYKINSAYLLRNRSYTKYYFKLKKLLVLTNDLRKFLDFIVDLPNDELKSIEEINKKIKILKRSSS